MDDDDLNRTYLKGDDYNVKVWLKTGECYLQTVHNVKTKEDAEAAITRHFHKNYPREEIVKIETITATPAND